MYRIDHHHLRHVSLGLSLALLLVGCDPVNVPAAQPNSTPLPEATPTNASTANAPIVRASAEITTVAAASRASRPNPARAYLWKKQNPRYEPLVSRLLAPAGTKRVAVTKGSYAWWLRHLPLRRKGTPVRAHDGALLLAAGDHRISAVVDLDLVPGDLQQCADSVLRLRAEYLFSRGRFDKISFRYTSGYRSSWLAWSRGARPVVTGNKVTTGGGGRADSSHAGFEGYLRNLFIYAGTVSLAREAARLEKQDIEIGDFFVLPGGPGHAVLIVDLARAPDGRLYALLAQGFMPAQDFQVLRAANGSSWFALDSSSVGVDTPMWPTFPWSALRRL